MSFAPWQDPAVVDGSAEFRSGDRSVVVKADYMVEE